MQTEIKHLIRSSEHATTTLRILTVWSVNFPHWSWHTRSFEEMCSWEPRDICQLTTSPLARRQKWICSREGTEYDSCNMYNCWQICSRREAAIWQGIQQVQQYSHSPPTCTQQQQYLIRSDASISSSVHQHYPNCTADWRYGIVLTLITTRKKVSWSVTSWRMIDIYRYFQLFCCSYS
jgi:hypothetical protein